MTSYRKQIPVLAISILIIVFWVVIEFSASPKRPIIDDVPELIFSRESGFYDDEFDLTISSSRGQVYYSVDGSVPDSGSLRYESPIHISDASRFGNVYSMRTDISTGFYTDLIEAHSAEDPQYKQPDYPVDKCTVVRAVIRYDDGSYSAVKTCSYFVGFRDKPGYDNVSYVSIVADPHDLFDYHDGCYVTGAVFDEYAGWADEYGWLPSWWHWTSNYSRDRSTEKQISVQFFDQDEKLILSQICGMRIRGGGSRGFIPKSLNLYAREEYDHNDHFIKDFWGDEYYPSKIALFQGGDDDKAKIMDYVMHELCRDLEFTTMRFEPYVMFLDGEYWGVYWLINKYDDNYLNHYYGVDRDNVIVVKHSPDMDPRVTDGEEDDLELYNEMREYCTNSDLTIEENFRKVFDEYLDYESTLDYYAAFFYVSRYFDWPVANYAMWRSRSADNDKYSDCKWRWMMFDVNTAAMTEDLTDFDPIDWAMRDAFFANLMTNDRFRNDLLDRIEYMRDQVFSEERVESVLQDYHVIMDEQLRYNCKRFYGDGRDRMYIDQINSVESFLKHRPETIGAIVDRYR